jgi:hypothetical protein
VETNPSACLLTWNRKDHTHRSNLELKRVKCLINNSFADPVHLNKTLQETSFNVLTANHVIFLSPSAQHRRRLRRLMIWKQFHKNLIGHRCRRYSAQVTFLWAFRATQSMPEIGYRFFDLWVFWFLKNWRTNGTEDRRTVKSTRAAGTWQD